MPRTAKIVACALTICLGIILSSPVHAADELPDLADRAQASVVSIVAENAHATPQANGTTKPNLSYLTGMVLSADGYFITAFRFIDDTSKITVTLSDGRQVAAQIAGRDARTQIALLKETSLKGLTPVHFGDAHQMRRGFAYFSIGNFNSLQNSLSTGIIAAIRPTGGPLPHTLFQTDTIVPSGGVGAPLFNMKGEVIGMFTGNFSSNNVAGLAVPSDIIKGVAERLQKSGVIDRGWMGVQVRKATDQEATAATLERGTGLMLVRVIDGAPAVRSGLAPGDIIATFNGQPIRDVAWFAWAVADQASNTEVTLGIVRKNARSDVKVKLAPLPDPQLVPPSPSSSSTSSSSSSSSPSAAPATPADAARNCLRFVPSVGMTVAVACDEQ
jgi:serine protease Do